MKINEHDCAVLTADLPGEGLETGDVGTVIHIHKGGAAYEVEFTTLDGRTLTVATVESKKLRPVSRRDVAHVTVTILDAQGRLVPIADNEVSFEIQGEGKIIGVDNGDPLSHEDFKGNRRKAFKFKVKLDDFLEKLEASV